VHSTRNLQFDREVIDRTESRLRLQTIVRLRWFAVLGQLIAVGVVWLGLGFSLPVGYCLSAIALSAWLNVYLALRFPARYRLSVKSATVLLAYDILQLALLLYLTGGINNPFTMLIVAPVTVSAATLPPRQTIALGAIALTTTALLVYQHWPLPWYTNLRFDLPLNYKLGILAAVGSCMTFLGLYTWRLTREAKQMSAALAATDLVLAREQKLHALDGLAAAAAHELGTPLSTIVLVAKELEHDTGDMRHREDFALLRQQAERCREILQKLTQRPSEQDPLHASVSVRALVEDAAAPYRLHGKEIIIRGRPSKDAAGAGIVEPVGERRPGLIYGLGNIIENAVDFAKSRVEIEAEWDHRDVTITVSDDGPGFPADMIDSVGEPYVTTRPRGAGKGDGETSGLGLGFFIAKTLLERSGASLSLDNRAAPAKGAIVRVNWMRSVFDISQPRAGVDIGGHA
jgi:two-component system sensor histidine kinase RegB